MLDTGFQFQGPGRLVDGDLELVLVETQRAIDSAWKVPAYIFHMRHIPSGSKMGRITFRIGDSRWITHFAGHIGYAVEEPFRGNGLAGRSCRLLLPFVRRHGIDPVWITCGPENLASRRTLEKLGAEMVEIIEAPPEYPLPEGADRRKCRYRI
jgi:predicted acetyltransferase